MTLSHAAKKIGEFCDAHTGVEGTAGYILLLFLTIIGYVWINDGFQLGTSKEAEEEEEEEPEPVRNFTAKQLRHFDGTKDENTEEDKPVYLSVSGKVFDVSKGSDFYGPGGPYECFAGRECGVALATMSFDESQLDDVAACETLGIGDRAELDNWLEKFEHYRSYPVKGRLVPESSLPSSDRIISAEELAKFNGLNEETPPEGYATPPIYVGALDKVFDCSFGGVPMYGKDGPYNKFAGKDVSRALALMSFNPEDIENSDISDLEDKKVKILKDWVNTFENKKRYPVAGKLDKA